MRLFLTVSTGAKIKKSTKNCENYSLKLSDTFSGHGVYLGLHLFQAEVPYFTGVIENVKFHRNITFHGDFWEN